MKTLAHTLLLSSVLLVSNAANAHGVWFAERSSKLAVVYGDGAEDLDTIKRQHKFRSPTRYDADWNATSTELTPSGPLLLIDTDIDQDKQASAVSVVMFNGIWSKTPDGKWHAKGRDEVPDSILSLTTFKYAVHLKGELKPVPVIETQRLQIIPLAPKGNHFPHHLGHDVTYQVLYEGKPVAGAHVIADLVTNPDAKPVITGNDGKATLAIRNQGLNVVAASYEGPAMDPKKEDKVEHLATLSFSLEHEEE